MKIPEDIETTWVGRCRWDRASCTFSSCFCLTELCFIVPVLWGLFVVQKPAYVRNM